MTPATLEAAIQAPTHPALRWMPLAYGDFRQHRRGPDGTATVCGLPGPLVLADPTWERCAEGCWD